MPKNLAVELAELVTETGYTVFSDLPTSQQQLIERQAEQFLWQALRGTQCSAMTELRSVVQTMVAGLMYRLGIAAGFDWNLPRTEFPMFHSSKVASAIKKVFHEKKFEVNDVVTHLHRIMAMGHHSHNFEADRLPIQNFLQMTLSANQQIVPDTDLRTMVTHLPRLLHHIRQDIPSFVNAFFPNSFSEHMLTTTVLFQGPKLLGGGCCDFTAKNHEELLDEQTEQDGLLPPVTPPQSKLSLLVKAKQFATSWLGSFLLSGANIMIWGNAAFLGFLPEHCAQIQRYQDAGGIGDHAGCNQLAEAKGNMALIFNAYDETTGKPSLSIGVLLFTLLFGICFMFFFLLCFKHTVIECFGKRLASRTATPAAMEVAANV